MYILSVSRYIFSMTPTVPLNRKVTGNQTTQVDVEVFRSPLFVRHKETTV